MPSTVPRPPSGAEVDAYTQVASIFAAAGFAAADVEPFAAAEDHGAWPHQAPAYRPLAGAMRVLEQNQHSA